MALGGYGAGLVGLVAVKVLAPGYYASLDLRTPVRIAIVVLVVTQLLNIALVPLFQHAGLALSIGLGALLNAAWLLSGLLRRGSFKPLAGWRKFLLQVLVANIFLAGLLWWGAQSFDWLALRGHSWQRMGLLAGFIAGAATLYFAVLWAVGMRPAQFARR